MSKPIYPQNSKLESAGFTLVELMVTVAIMAIIAGFTFGNMNTASYRLKSTAKILAGNMQKARLLAVKENCRVYVDFDLDGGGTIDQFYTLWRDLDDGTPNPTDPKPDGNYNASVTPSELIETVTLPGNISFGTVANGNGGPATTPAGGALPADGVWFSVNVNSLRFSPQGTSSNGNAYLYAPANNEAGTHAVGTNAIGRVRSSYYATEGGDWN